MTKEIAERLKPTFKKDFKKARYQAACINNFGQFGSEKDKRRYNRKCILFDVTKELYIECLNIIITDLN